MLKIQSLTSVLIISFILLGSGTITQESLSVEEYHNCPATLEECESTPNKSKATPTVTYPTKQEIYAYINSSGGKKEFTPLSNSSQGFASNIKTAVAGNTTWVAWEGNVNGTNKVYLKVSYNESLIYTPAVEISAPTSGNASKLQLAASDDGTLVYAAWQDTNMTTGKNSIYVSASMNGGEEFKTYTLNTPNDADSVDPELTVVGQEVLINWIQAGSNGTCSQNNYTACSHGRW